MSSGLTKEELEREFLHEVIGTDLGREEQSGITFGINITSLARDDSVAKYNHLANEIMQPLFTNILFKDNFEIERFIDALTQSSRSHGSAAIIRMRNGFNK